jgi:EmrB/QacA subfamily drug resistance transporter
MFPSSRTSRPLVIASIMATMFMVAIEATIVSTAMPQIVAELGGLQFYSWVFSSFLLTQTAMTVVFGKLSDIYGRRPMMLVGIAIFLAGSVLAGFAWSMPSMIAFRLIQGIGAGAMQPVAMTIVADLYPARERGKIQGYLASVWATSAVIGPLAGGIIIHHLSWAWIFWINVPLGLVAAAGFIAFLHERVKRESRSIDIPGAALFTIAIAALMVALTETLDAGWGPTLVAVALFCVCGVLFMIWETRAKDPMISLSLWAHRPIAAVNGATLLAGMALMGLTTFLPIYVQGVLHQSTIVAGLALTMLMVGWPTGATVAARTLRRFGLRQLIVTGSVLIPIGAAVFVLLTPSSSPTMAGVGSLIMGFGMGLVSVSALVLIQEIVDWSQRGSVTASNLFARNLGSTLGAALLGAVLNFGLSRSENVGPVTSDRLRQLLEGRGNLSTADAAIHTALAQSLHLTFLVMFLLSLAVVLFALWVPRQAIGQADERPAE